MSEFDAKAERQLQRFPAFAEASTQQARYACHRSPKARLFLGCAGLAAAGRSDDGALG